MVATKFFNTTSLEPLVDSGLPYWVDHHVGRVGIRSGILSETKTMAEKSNGSSIPFLRFAPNSDCGAGLLYCKVECEYTCKTNEPSDVIAPLYCFDLWYCSQLYSQQDFVWYEVEITSVNANPSDRSIAKKTAVRRIAMFKIFAVSNLMTDEQNNEK